MPLSLLLATPPSRCDCLRRPTVSSRSSSLSSIYNIYIYTYILLLDLMLGLPSESYTCIKRQLAMARRSSSVNIACQRGCLVITRHSPGFTRSEKSFSIYIPPESQGRELQPRLSSRICVSIIKAVTGTELTHGCVLWRRSSRRPVLID